VEDGVVGHERYANPIWSLDRPYSPRNIVSGKQASYEAHRGLLDNVSKSSALRSNKCSKENLLLLNESEGVSEVNIVRRGWLRGGIRSNLTRIRGRMMGCGSNNLIITKHPIKVNT